MGKSAVQNFIGKAIAKISETWGKTLVVRTILIKEEIPAFILLELDLANMQFYEIFRSLKIFIININFDSSIFARL